MTQAIWAESALLPGGWANGVALEIDENGNIMAISTDTAYVQGDKHSVIIPGIANVHSHAHQRAMAGLSEYAGESEGLADSFWSWRKIMYHYLQRIEPHHLFHIASQLYLEMLKHGYTGVAEFQYLHHDIDGCAYANPAEMSLQCLQAAEQIGIGFTALPVLYRYGGFGSIEPVGAQKRFINDANSFCRIVETLQQASKMNTDTTVGMAPHSLRAVDEALLSSVLSNLGTDNLAAVHIHIAEQLKEVDDCISWSGRRPVDWLFNHFEVDSKWCLIHATHLDENETHRMAESGCVAGLCPTTEANLGDGFFNIEQYNRQSGKWAIGSDSHISIDPVEELRWLEYGSRLLSHRRNVLVNAGKRHTGRSLLDACWQGGELATGRRTGQIEVGYRADLIVLDMRHPRLYARKEDSLLDSWIFSGNQNLVQHVYVGGRRLITDGRHSNEEQVAENYRRTLAKLAG